MTADEIRAIHRADPFQPFKVRLKDGREFHVPLRMCFGVHPMGETAAVALPEDAFEVFDVEDIEEILIIGAWSNGKRKVKK